MSKTAMGTLRWNEIPTGSNTFKMEYHFGEVQVRGMVWFSTEYKTWMASLRLGEGRPFVWTNEFRNIALVVPAVELASLLIREKLVEVAEDYVQILQDMEALEWGKDWHSAS